MAIKISGYVPYTKEQIDLSIYNYELDMVKCLLTASKYNSGGSNTDKWLMRADLASLKIHTLRTKCKKKVYTFLDESLTEADFCKVGVGVGFVKISGGGNPLNCNVLVVKERSEFVTPSGTFRYCTFRTNTFREPIGDILPCIPIIGGLDYELDFELN